MNISRSDIAAIILAAVFIIVLSCPFAKHPTKQPDNNKDSLETEWYKAQLQSYPFDHSQIPLDTTSTNTN